MSPVIQTVLLLIASNVFMTFTLSVFVPFAWLYMKEPMRLNYLWAGLCMCGAVYFMFRR